GGYVHRGFAEALDHVWDEIDSCLTVEVPPDCPILYTGHSLGGALAILAATRRRPDALYTFGAPRVGDVSFNHYLEGLPFHRVVNDCDVVAMVPTPGPLLWFKHGGQLHRLAPGRSQESTSPDGSALKTAFDAIRSVMSGVASGRWHEPSPPLANHAPINYVARLYQSRQEAISGSDVE
ncbi:MAG: lipase family protein, partial [Planctomycetota bacterium]|nr:lipase family protein [Planctomycetota bacterium]